MTAKKTQTGNPKPAAKPAQEFVTLETLEATVAPINAALGRLADFLEAQAAAKPTVPETPIEKEVRKAGPDTAPMNPEFEEKAKEILGDSLGHCELHYLKGGGLLFTVVIAEGKSNAPVDYLNRMGSDRRTKEIGTEGISGVENWCKLIKQNLARPRL